MRKSGYGVFVRFRKRRLTLKRRLPSIEAARALVEEVRRNSFHAREDIFILDETTGETVADDPTEALREDGPNYSRESALLERALEHTKNALAKLCEAKEAISTDRPTEPEVPSARRANGHALESYEEMGTESVVLQGDPDADS